MSDTLLDRALAFQDQADLLESQGDDRGAEAALRQSLALFEELDGPESPDVANLLRILGAGLNRRGHYVEAVDCGTRAVAIMEKLLPLFDGPDGARILIEALATRSAALRELGRYSEAEPGLRQAIELCESGLPGDFTILAHSLNNFGVLCKYSGKFADGAQAYQRALRLVLENEGERNLLAAVLYHNIGGLEHARGDYQAAELPARRAWEIRFQLLGADDPHVYADACAYGGVLDGLGRYAESKAIYEKALVFYEELHGPSHFEVAATLNNLSSAELGLGNSDAAIRHCRRALAIKQELFGEDHPEWALTANNLAMMLLEEAGTRGEAVDLLRRALATAERRLAEGHPTRERIGQNLATCLEFPVTF